MTEIKSSIEIALEKASILGLGNQDEIANEEGYHQGKLLSRRVVAGNISAPELVTSITKLPKKQQLSAIKTIIEVLLTKVDIDKHQVIESLLIIAKGTSAEQYTKKLKTILDKKKEKIEQLDRILINELLLFLKTLNIRGSALYPNPITHPQYKQRYQTALMTLELSHKKINDELRNIWKLIDKLNLNI